MFAQIILLLSFLSLNLCLQWSNPQDCREKYYDLHYCKNRLKAKLEMAISEKGKENRQVGKVNQLVKEFNDANEKCRAIEDSWAGCCDKGPSKSGCEEAIYTIVNAKNRELSKIGDEFNGKL